MSNWTNDELQQAIAEIARRSSVDLEFRALALKDSAAAVAKVNSKRLPKDFPAIQFHDNTSGTLHITLPDPIPGMEELSEEELAAAAGGANNVSVQVDGGTGKAAAHGLWSR